MKDQIIAIAQKWLADHGIHPRSNVEVRVGFAMWSGTEILLGVDPAARKILDSLDYDNRSYTPSFGDARIMWEYNLGDVQVHVQEVYESRKEVLQILEDVE